MNYFQIERELEKTRHTRNAAQDLKDDCAHRFELEPELRRELNDEIAACCIHLDELYEMKRKLKAELSDRENQQYWMKIPAYITETGLEMLARFECQNCLRTSFENTGKPCRCHEEALAVEAWDSDMGASINR